MKGMDRPLRRRVMARWRAVNSSCMGTSVVRPLAVAHGGNSRQREVEEVHDPAKAEITDRERNDHLSVRCNKKRNDQLSEKNCTISCRFATNKAEGIRADAT